MKIHLISHTHWDREWYLPFQQFRLKLVHLMDNLLELLANDPNYHYFMLDGQTIVLDDYLAVRPERYEEIRAHVQQGRLLIGPWHILPDEFLVSPEATVRNLLEGERTTRRFGGKMTVGYIPDPFGHIAQMPQILRGFGIDTACVQRGVGDEPAEFWWQAPDGSKVFMAYLRDGYGNASGLPTADGERFVSEVLRLSSSLAPHSASASDPFSGGHLLFMQGTDHMEPQVDTAQAIAYANERLGTSRLVHSTLPAYLEAVRSHLEQSGAALPTLHGELRSSKRHHLLPGVLSSRMWIKQRNHACETLLEKWVEPFSTWAALVQPKTKDEEAGGAHPTGLLSPLSGQRLKNTPPLVRQAWRLLMENHPHDSICGCSIDQVHNEMRPRFDQVEQIGEELTRQSLQSLADAVDNRPPAAAQGALSAITVFNPHSSLQAGWVEAGLLLPDEVEAFEIVDAAGRVLPHQVHGHASQELFNATLDREGLLGMLGTILYGRIGSFGVRKVDISRDGDTLTIAAVLDESGEPDPGEWDRATGLMTQLLEDPALQTFHLIARTRVHRKVAFAAPEVPGVGLDTFWVRSAGDSSAPPAASGEDVITNEYLRVEVDRSSGTLTLTDLRSGAVFPGINRFIDSGDAGDEYNYSPPGRDLLVDQVEVRQVQVLHQPGQQTITLHLEMAVPLELAESRSARSAQTVGLDLITRATLTTGVPRLDIQTRVHNTARDHRLRVHFPAPYPVDEALYDGHFAVVSRPLDLPVYDPSWVEQPRPEAPQRAFCALFGEKVGLVLANRGLPEVEVRRTEHGSEAALTLLRCTGWLSRDDLSTRRGHAGPMIATPGAQEPGWHTFNYSVIPAQDRQAGFHQAYAFNAPLRAASSSLHGGRLAAREALVRVSAENFMITTIKMAEGSHPGEVAWLVRGWSMSSQEIELGLSPWRPFRRSFRTNLAEEALEELPITAGGSVSIQVRPYEVVTVLFQDSDRIYQQ